MAFVTWAVLMFLVSVLLIGRLTGQWYGDIFSSLNQQRFAIIAHESGFHTKLGVPQFGDVHKVNLLSEPAGLFGMISSHGATFSVAFVSASSYAGVVHFKFIIAAKGHLLAFIPPAV